MAEETNEEDLDQYFTAEKLAKRMVEWAGPYIPGMKVLEPSAGDGGLVRFIPPEVRLTAVELEPMFCGQIRQLLMKEKRSGEVIEGDFLAYAKTQPEGAFDLAVMNPPYGDGRDGAHVLAAARISKRAVALVRTNFENGHKRFNQLMRWATMMRRAVLVGRPRFYGPSDKGHKARHDYVIVDLRMRTAELDGSSDRLEVPKDERFDLVQNEYWTERW